mmetsp:Transcript_1853/g.7430  ORF Transcript_1853/g.7430 Transcript_1853/m.7430 type:complete len:220 (-) Transcript_1853:477-1136(-)
MVRAHVLFPPLLGLSHRAPQLHEVRGDVLVAALLFVQRVRVVKQLERAVKVAAPVVRQRQQMPDVHDVVTLVQELLQHHHRLLRVLVQLQQQLRRLEPELERHLVLALKLIRLVVFLTRVGVHLSSASPRAPGRHRPAQRLQRLLCPPLQAPQAGHGLHGLRGVHVRLGGAPQQRVALVRHVLDVIRGGDELLDERAARAADALVRVRVSERGLMLNDG